MQKRFIAPMLISLVVLAGVWWWGGAAALLFAAVLAVLEITLSLDNAVVNAKVLEKMPRRWQQRFLTWGMAISVVGVRVILPILIVSAVAFISPLVITKLALIDPLQYATLIAQAQPAIDAFGGIFLFLVACGFFFDTEKEVHWLHPLERRLAKWGDIRALELVLALALLLMVGLQTRNPAIVLGSGVVGVVLYMLMQAVLALFDRKTAVRSGLGLFLYINLLDAAFSLDGVVGAFAITVVVPIIIAGLGIGAYFVRTITLMLVEGGQLRELTYLEHGAHWAVFALSTCMLLSLVATVPEWFTATIGLIIIVLSYLSSRRARVVE